MGERDLVLASLGILDTNVWAQGSAYRQVRQDYNLAGGHKQSWIGYNAYTYLLDRLDRVFQCGEFAPPPDQDSAGRDVLAFGIADRDFRTMPVLHRRDLNSSPGWTADGWRGGRGARRLPVGPVLPTGDTVADADVRVRRPAGGQGESRAIGEA
ncbi:hypothetical protein GCM10022222_64210 [Amycolatopsis ultiminotia]|uniref:Uncharacterized protein n=1 Tax=Amycolatopsis ultiminotia TaxID=543629 RepID=A0ABP6XTN4_9PSEU